MPALNHITKTCSSCGAVKPATEFHKNPKMADGRISKCKACVSDYNRRRFQENPDYRARQLALVRANLDPAKKREADLKASAKYPEKHPARNAVKYAVKTGKISKPDHCEICASTDRIHGHHHDYSKPLDVWWLCDHCHKLIHRLMRSVARSSIAATKPVRAA